MDWDSILERTPLGIAVVTHEFVARNDDELSLRTGERVTIHSKDAKECGDDGWWFGTIGERIGLLPENYVEILPSDTTEDNSQTVSSDSFGFGEQTTKLFEIPYHELKLEKVIGSGGFGAVYRAKYRRMTVAVKVFRKGGLSEEEIREKTEELRAEGILLAGLSHVNIAKLYGAAADKDEFCLVMEYAQGGALNTVLYGASLEPATIVDWAKQIAKGMNYLHEESPVSVVHRDLKSSNILLARISADGSPLYYGNILKITDFGLARTFTRTTEMTTAGTFAWMAPEVIRTSTFSKGSDVWSFGVLLWELLTGQTPYRGTHMMTIAYSVAVKGSTLPIPSNCPQPFEELMKDSWRSEAAERSSFAQILLRLQNAEEKFVATPNINFKALQDQWRDEMTGKFEELKKSKEEIVKQEEEVAKVQKDQEAKAKQLDEKERELQELKAELDKREEELKRNKDAVGGGQPKPAKRNPNRSKVRRFRKAKKEKSPKKIQKKDIGAPIVGTFEHINHVDNEGLTNLSIHAIRMSPIHVSPSKWPPDVETDAGAAETATPRTLTPGSPGLRSVTPADQWQCARCTVKNHPDMPHCEVCECPAPHLAPVPPTRMNPPSVRGSISSTYSTSPFLDPDDSDNLILSPREKEAGKRLFGDVTGFEKGSAFEPLAPPRRTTSSSSSTATSETLGESIPGSPSSNNSSPKRKWPGFLRRTSSPRSSPHHPRVQKSLSFDTSPRSRALSVSSALPRRLLSRRATTSAISNPFNVQHHGHISDNDNEMKTSTMPRWLQPDWTREKVSEYLRECKAGSFIIRASKSRLGNFSLCVVKPDNEYWFGDIVQTEGRYRLGDGKISFSSLSQLVRHFTAFPYAKGAFNSPFYLLPAGVDEIIGDQEGTHPSDEPPVFTPHLRRANSESSLHSINEDSGTWDQDGGLRGATSQLTLAAKRDSIEGVSHHDKESSA